MFGKTKQKEQTYGKSHVRKNDTVIVTTGRDRGKEGKVLRVIPSKGTAIVERVNFLKKHSRKNPAKNEQGGIVEREAPIKISNLAVLCPSCGERTRVLGKITDQGVVRSCRKCQAELGSK